MVKAVVDEVGSDVVGIRLSPFTEFYGAYESGMTGFIVAGPFANCRVAYVGCSMQAPVGSQAVLSSWHVGCIGVTVTVGPCS